MRPAAGPFEASNAQPAFFPGLFTGELRPFALDGGARNLRARREEGFLQRIEREALLDLAGQGLVADRARVTYQIVPTLGLWLALVLAQDPWVGRCLRRRAPGMPRRELTST